MVLVQSLVAVVVVVVIAVVVVVVVVVVEVLLTRTKLEGRIGIRMCCAVSVVERLEIQTRAVH